MFNREGDESHGIFLISLSLHACIFELWTSRNDLKVAGPPLGQPLDLLNGLQKRVSRCAEKGLV